MRLIDRTFWTCVFVVCALAPAVAQSASPPPKATPAPVSNPIKLSGNLRMFYFTRSNRDPNVINASAFNVEGKLHGEYQFGKTPWTVGASYFGAEPFGANGSNPGFNPRVDNTLPGYALSLLGEYYLQYKNKYVEGKTGKEIITTPWANPSDSRLVPVIFQGTYLQGAISPTLTVGGMYMARFRHRVTSAFDANTLLTSCATGRVLYGTPPKLTGVPGDPCNVQQTTRGFGALYATKKFGANLTSNVYQYSVYDIVNITHIDAKYNYRPKAPTNPFYAAQYVAESDTGKALIGTIHNHTFGFQIGQSAGRNFDLALSYNSSPQVQYITNNCSSTPGGVFGGVKGAAVPGAPAGTVYCYGGGVASPYTDSYATDPLYTTTISQGLADVHKPGSGVKGAITYQSNNRRLKAILAQAYYSYGLPVANGTDNRSETNVDVQYFFNPVDPKKPYRGLSVRHRYADRIQLNSPFDFKYNRTQLEYTF